MAYNFLSAMPTKKINWSLTVPVPKNTEYYIQKSTLVNFLYLIMIKNINKYQIVFVKLLLCYFCWFFRYCANNNQTIQSTKVLLITKVWFKLTKLWCWLQAHQIFGHYNKTVLCVCRNYFGRKILPQKLGTESRWY